MILFRFKTLYFLVFGCFFTIADMQAALKPIPTIHALNTKLTSTLAHVQQLKSRLMTLQDELRIAPLQQTIQQLLDQHPKDVMTSTESDSKKALSLRSRWASWLPSFDWFRKKPTVVSDKASSVTWDTARNIITVAIPSKKTMSRVVIATGVFFIAPELLEMICNATIGFTSGLGAQSYQ